MFFAVFLHDYVTWQLFGTNPRSMFGEAGGNMGNAKDRRHERFRRRHVVMKVEVSGTERNDWHG